MCPDSKTSGRWSAKIDLPNVAIHANLLPTEKVLFWGRRDSRQSDLDQHTTLPYIWDPITDPDGSKIKTIERPLSENGEEINLFCSGHTFLADGRLLVAGGHISDSVGLDQACLFDPSTEKWESIPEMNWGRWYPSAITLQDGRPLVFAGSIAFERVNNNTPQIWNEDSWINLVNFPKQAPLYPRIHLAPDGRVFMSGPLARSYFLDTGMFGKWIEVGDCCTGSRSHGLRDYAPSVMYDIGKIIYIGGGNDDETHAPTNAAEIIDLNAPVLKWEPTNSMNFARRQHNATILPDGTVLVTGGTKGGGGTGVGGFNDLTPGQPVHTAELWDPETGAWTILADEDFDRCYHSVAVLLPDATVLSAGGGEYRPTLFGDPNDDNDSHHTAQIFSPPYLFKGTERPVITSSPQTIKYKDKFEIKTDRPDSIKRVSLVRLSSVTHSINFEQRINFLDFERTADSIIATAPQNGNVCPPGFYMLFLLNTEGVPSIAKMIHVSLTGIQQHQPIARTMINRAARLVQHFGHIVMTNLQRFFQWLNTILKKWNASSGGNHVLIGLTPTCPYGLSSCWGGAYEALQKLDGVRYVKPIANRNEATAEAFIDADLRPDLNKWKQQFKSSAKGSYDFRGIELTLHGSVKLRNDKLMLHPRKGNAIVLRPLQETCKVQWDARHDCRKYFESGEENAYDHLLKAASERKEMAVTVSGPYIETDGEPSVQVRLFHH